MSSEQVQNKCITICGDNRGEVSCSKILFVDVIDLAKSNVTFRLYAIIHDQSNSSRISGEVADILRVALKEKNITCQQQ
jgi:ribosomal protein S4E